MEFLIYIFPVWNPLLLLFSQPVLKVFRICARAFWRACPFWARLSSCARIWIFEVGLHCPFILPDSHAGSLWDLQCLHQLSELQAAIHWMLFLNSPTELRRVEEEDTDSHVGGSHLGSYLGLGDRLHAVSRICTSRFKQVKTLSGQMTFLWC